MKRIFLCFALILVLTGILSAEERTVGVQCSCDPPGTYRPAGFDCRGHCTHSSGGGTAAPPAGPSIQQQVVTTAVGAFMQGFMSAALAPPPPPDPAVEAALEQQRAEAERQRQEALRRAQEEQERRHKELMSGLKDVYNGPELAMKNELPPPLKPAEPSIIAEAEELLRRCTAADEAADRALADEKSQNSRGRI